MSPVHHGGYLALTHMQGSAAPSSELTPDDKGQVTDFEGGSDPGLSDTVGGSTSTGESSVQREAGTGDHTED